ncbi:MAG: TraB/GumN family protein [Dehalococcoidales bacterium]
MRYWIKVTAGLLAVFLVFFLIFEAVSYWQDNKNSDTETPGKSFVWKISSQTNHIYLLGSIHYASEDLYPLDGVIEAAFNSADYLVVEVNVSNIDSNDPYYRDAVLKYATYPQREGLKENLPGDLYNQLKVKLAAYGVDITSVNPVRPWLLSMAMGTSTGQELNLSTEYGIDYHFLLEAQKNNMRILQLEGFIDELSALSAVPDEVMVKEILSDNIFYSAADILNLLFDAWETGNAAKMEGVTYLGPLFEPEMAPYNEIILEQRTHNWMNKIEKYLADDETYFVVVGAGHLVGEKGLLNLLKNEGYTIEQLNDID